MKTRFCTLLCRDIQNARRQNKAALAVTAGLFLIGAVVTDMKGPLSYIGSGPLSYFIYGFEGCDPFFGRQSGPFQLPLPWFLLNYFCVYTALHAPIKDLHCMGLQVLLRADSRWRWWTSKCLSVLIWDAVYYLTGLLALTVFSFAAHHIFLFDSSAHKPAPEIAILCLLPVLFGMLLSLMCFCLSLFTSYQVGHIFAITYLIATAFFQPHITVGSYASLLRCAEYRGEGLKGANGIGLMIFLLVLIYLVGWRLFKRHDLYSARKEATNEN